MRVEEMSPGVSQLIVSDVRRSYAGQLSCSAYNDAGSTDTNFTVVVHCKHRYTRLENLSHGYFFTVVC